MKNLNAKYDATAVREIARVQGDVSLENSPMKKEDLMAEDVKIDEPFDQFNRTYITIAGEKVRATLKKGASKAKQVFTAELYRAVKPFTVQGNNFPIGYPSVKLS